MSQAQVLQVAERQPQPEGTNPGPSPADRPPRLGHPGFFQVVGYFAGNSGERPAARTRRARMDRITSALSATTTPSTGRLGGCLRGIILPWLRCTRYPLSGKLDRARV